MGGPIRYAVIPPEGPVHVEEGVLSYDALTAIVGWPLEVIPVGTGAAVMYACEEGKANGAPSNPRATTLAHLRNPRDFVVGTVLVCGPADNFGNDTSIPSVVEKMVVA